MDHSTMQLIESVLTGGGEMGERMRAVDWSTTALDRYPLSAAKQAYDDFEHGRLVGRAVLMPETLKDADRGPTTSSRIAAVSGAV